MPNYVFSTLATNMNYTHWLPGADGGTLPSEGKTIYIKGGATVAHKSGSSDVWTPLGFATEVSDEELGLLEQNQVFNLHRKNGYIKVEKKNKDVEKAVSDMNRVDKSSPKVEADFPDFIVSIDTPKSNDPHRI